MPSWYDELKDFGSTTGSKESHFTNNCYNLREPITDNRVRIQQVKVRLLSNDLHTVCVYVYIIAYLAQLEQYHSNKQTLTNCNS